MNRGKVAAGLVGLVVAAAIMVASAQAQGPVIPSWEVKVVEGDAISCSQIRLSNQWLECMSGGSYVAYPQHRIEMIIGPRLP